MFARIVLERNNCFVFIVLLTESVLYIYRYNYALHDLTEGVIKS